MSVPDEIQVGPLVLSYERPGLTVAKGTINGDGEAIGYCEIVTPEEWAELATVLSGLLPEPPDLEVDHNHRDAEDLYWKTCPACAMIEGYYRGASERTPPGSGASSIAEERFRQINDEGWTAEHDDAEHLPGDLVAAAIAYAIYSWKHVMRDRSGNPSGWTENQVLDLIDQWWPFDGTWWKPGDDPIRTLVKAGALIAAEIDRLRRAT